MKDVLRKAKEREDYEKRKKEQENNTLRRAKAREDYEKRKKEQESDTLRRAKTREDPYVKEVERVTKQSKRLHSQNSSRNYVSNKKLKTSSKKSSFNNNIDVIQLFKEEVSKCCDFQCTCCSQLFFRHSVVTVPRLNISNDLRNQCISDSNSDKQWICHTCLSYLKKQKLPPLSKANGMIFPPRTNELDLNCLEERLVSPINVFMQMRELPSGRQACVHGNVVNVPADNITTVQMLPRRLNQSDTVPVKLKRRLRYTSHYMYENVRPQKCLDATHTLLSKPLFSSIVRNGVDENWLENSIIQLQDTDWGNFIDNQLDPSPEQQHSDELNKDKGDMPAHEEEDSMVIPHHVNIDNQPNVSISPEQQHIESDEWSEDEGDRPVSGEMDTMLTPSVIEMDGQHNMSVAPSEGNTPISIFTDNIEELVFPTIFCGESRPANENRQVPVKYSDLCKSELRRSDRRAAGHITNIFFKTRKLQLKQIQDKVWLSMRRNKTKGKTYTAKDVKDKQVVDNMVKLDEGYRIFRSLRGSPPYWESAKKDIFAMIRQLGLPTWFISLSAAETHWVPLLQSLGRLIDKKQYSEEEVNNMTWDIKTRLIKSDPVTVARYFDFRVQQFFKIFLLSKTAPLGIVKDFFYRIEFQHRGSPHIHGLLWIDNAPLFNSDPIENIESFISNHITTSRSDDPMVKYQIHRHSHSCRKKKKKQCRFNFPLPPMQDTYILQPLDEIRSEEITTHKENWDIIDSALSDIGTTSEVSFEDFLQSINLSQEEYLLAIRSSITDPKVFLKRSPDAIRVNGYSLDIMNNHDIQFVLDAYACAMYIVSYISKGQRGMSELLRKTCEEAKHNGSDIRSQVRAIGNKFTRHSEMSAQEAVFISLQMPLRRSSRSVIFINTSPPEERPFILKSDELLQILPDDSVDIQSTNVFSRYKERPRKINDMCLADFATWYDLVTKNKKRTSKKVHDPKESDMEDNEDDNPNQDITEDSNQGLIKLPSGSTLRKRKKSKVLRCVRYDVKKDPENHFRELLLLFYPWWDEARLLGSSSTYEDKYNLFKIEIDAKRNEYQHFSEQLDLAERQMEENLENNDERFDEVAPTVQHAELQDMDRDVETDEDNLVFTEYDVGADIGVNSLCGTDVRQELIKNRVSDSQFRADVRALNTRQREIFDHILKKVKSTEDQIFLFLTGGAGVGKSRVTKTIHQAL